MNGHTYYNWMVGYQMNYVVGMQANRLCSYLANQRPLYNYNTKISAKTPISSLNYKHTGFSWVLRGRTPTHLQCTPDPPTPSTRPGIPTHPEHHPAPRHHWDVVARETKTAQFKLFVLLWQIFLLRPKITVIPKQRQMPH